MRVIVTKPQIYFEHRTLVEGEQLDLDDQTAKELIQSGVVREPPTPRVVYSTKVIVPESSTIQPEAPEVRPRPPFRNVPMRNTEPAPVAPEGDSVLSGADIPDKGVADNLRFRRRKGFDPG